MVPSRIVRYNSGRSEASRGEARQAGEYGNELGLHHAREEMLEALEMLHRLHRGDLKALVPETITAICAAACPQPSKTPGQTAVPASRRGFS